MKRTILIGFILVGAQLVWVIPHLSQLAFGQNASVEAPHAGEGGVPQFQEDLSWPKVPAKWRMGFGSAIRGDSDGNVWVLSRPVGLAHPRSTPPDLASVPAPPIMEFDQEGNFIRGWGGVEGKTYPEGYQWPSNEHGLTVDYKGFVWIVGNADDDLNNNNPAHGPNDNQIIKFTKEGKFVMAIGKSGQTGSNATEVLKGATGLYVYPKTNELFVTDGYGNSRVMVYDANTGKFKRMWGAYGHKPLNIDQRPPRSKLSLNPWVAVSEVLQQYDTPHDVTVSSDGLVYIADRGNKRIQVFTTDGKFIKEQFLGLDLKYGLSGARGVALSPDERFLYVGGTPVIWILNRKTLELLGSFETGSSQGDSIGHLIGSDNKGNVYAVRAELSGAFGDPHTGAYKYTFKGYSPKVACPPCTTVRTDLNTPSVGHK